MKQTRPIIFGEVLFDCFSDGTEVLGGAPFNVAWHLQAFGLQPILISRIGDDRRGEDIIRKMNCWGMNTDFIQIDLKRPTGTVKVYLNNGEPIFEILKEDAYGNIQAKIPKLPAGSSFLYHGSLALWRTSTRTVINTLKQKYQFSVFIDINLRSPWWEHGPIFSLLEGAFWLKLNEEELRLLIPYPDIIEEKVEVILKDFHLRTLIVTRGGKGATVYSENGQSVSVVPSSQVKITDTVGAGDAFSAIFILGLALGWPTEIIVNRAQEFASAIVGQRGATIQDRQFYSAFLVRWGNI